MNKEYLETLKDILEQIEKTIPQKQNKPISKQRCPAVAHKFPIRG
ncbi:hypothetical protein [Clostridium estertheticum]|nr:hypothetical protein [Clostridium estertheticum]